MSKVAEEKQLNELSSKEWVRHTKSWFICDGKPSDISNDIELHPASFPPELIERFIRFFTKEQDTILDPFVGTGSTLVAAYKLKRNGIGIELNEDFFKNTKKRISKLKREPRLLDDNEVDIEVIHGDAMQIDEMNIGEIDFCITSPPYADMLKQSRGNVDSEHKKRIRKGYPTSYGENPANLGNIESYTDYIAALVDIFRKIQDIMKFKGYLIIILQNFRDVDGEMKPLAWDVAKKLGEYYTLQQEFIWCQNQKPLGCWGYPTTYVSNVHHHYCLVLRNDK